MARGENVFQRKDGRFEARYIKGRKADGKLIYGFCYGRTYEEAREKAVRARKKLEDESNQQSGRDASFSHFCDMWLFTNKPRLKASSYEKYNANINKYIKPFFGDRLPWKIASEEIDAFTQMLLYEKKLSVKTVRSILTLLHSLLSYVGKRSGERLPDLEITYPKAYKKNVRVLDEKEEEALTEILAQDMDFCKFGIYLALRTGMRLGEICALRWCDISFETSTIAICHTAQRLPKEFVSNSEDEDHLKTVLIMDSPKSDSSLRTIPLMPDIDTLCRRFYIENPDAFILTGTERCLDPRKLQRHLKKCLQECGIENAHFHTLRHTFATRCIEAGFDVKTLSEILGHSNINITMNQYVHPSLDLKRENMNRLKAGILL